ncbi:MAG: tyrosine-type recombinase/integrase [Lachnospiraceae bacterium]|nr:tyrosine-type recombinase/integrase [Lachnospiraceae bacterium]
MSDRAYRVLSRLWERAEDKEGFVFLYKGHPIKTQTVNSHLERACEYLDIRYISNHNIRATGATAALAEGMDEMTVKRLGVEVFTDHSVLCQRGQSPQGY